MFSLRLYVLFIFLLYFYNYSCNNSYKNIDDIAIQDLNLLLPLTTGKIKSSYNLKAYNGCFKWISTNPEIITVNPLYNTDACNIKSTNNNNPFLDHISNDNGCSTECIVSVSQNILERRTSSFIIAEDLISGRKVRCEVHVDKIDRIEIETTSRRMYHDDIEELQVLAFDSIGNLFSTLEGLHFQWSIVSTNKNVGTPALKRIPFLDSNIEVSNSLIEMEKQGKESYSVLVQGIDNGNVYVHCRLIEYGYDNVDQSTIIISVLEPLELHPLQPVYLSPGSTLQYELKTFKNEYTRTISMPNSRYIWSVENTNIASVNNRGLVIAKDLGSTSVIVQYEDMLENNAQGFISVVMPARLALKIIPEIEEDNENISGIISSNWYLINGYTYILSVEVYDNNGHHIMLSPDMYFDIEIPLEGFSIKSKSHARYIITAKKEGLCQVSAVLYELINSNTREKIHLPSPLITRQDIVISSPVSIIPSHVNLPYDPNVRHMFSLKAIGGNKEYNWYSADNNIVTVDSIGKISSGIKGSTQIMATDTRNPINRGISEISILPVSSIEIIPIRREVQVGNDLLISIAFYDKNGQRFDNCTALTFKWSITDMNIFEPVKTLIQYDKIPIEHKPKIEKACTFRTIRALKAGYSNIIIYFGDISTEMTFFAFNPLSITPHKTLVTLGSSYDYSLENGPNPWYFEPSVYDAAIIPEKRSSVKLERIPSHINGRYNFRVTCLEYGQQELLITTGNKATSTNPFPETSTTSVVFSCFIPSALFIYPILPNNINNIDNKCDNSFKWKNILDNNNYSSWPSSLSLLNKQTIQFNSILLDYNGYRFDNISSLNFKWDSTHPLIAEFDNKNTHIINLNLSDKSGKSLLSSKIIDYNKQILLSNSIRYPSTSEIPSLISNIDLISFSNIIINPTYQILYLQSLNIGYIDIIGGSSYSSIFSNNTNILSLRNNKDNNNRVEIIPYQEGNSKITVIDKCLQGSKEVYSYITISNIEYIQIHIIDIIPIGKIYELKISIYDKNNNLFDSSQYKYMNLEIQQDNNFLEISQNPNNPMIYNIKGKYSGITNILVYSHTSKISSNSKQIYIYTPFTLTPKDIILLPGISYQVNANGGPPTGTSIKYISSKSSIATVTSSGIITAISKGESIITAISEGIDKTTGNLVKYGEAQSTVYVNDANDIQISSPSNTILLGNSMNIYVLGTNGESPFSFGSNLYFSWLTTNNDVLEIKPRYHKSKCSLEQEHMFSIQVYAKNQGSARIQVSTDIKSSGLLSSTKTYTTSTIINVIEPLKILSPHTLILTPNTEYSIKTTLDYLQTLQYSILYNNCENLGSNYIPCSINNNGIIKTSSKTGICYILIQEIETSQSQIIIVEVKHIHMIQLEPNNNNNNNVYLTMPLGEQMILNVNYLDDIAQQFHNINNNNNDFSVQSNSKEIISTKVNLSSNEILIQALKPGSAILKISLLDLNDYLEIRVGNTIIPNTPTVHIGSIIHFKPQFNINTNGKWKSSQSNILKINSETGYANTLQSGIVDVSLENEGQITYSRVTITQIDHIEFNITNDRILSNYNRIIPYLIPINFYGNGKQINASDNEYIENNIHYSCIMDPPQFSIAKASIIDDISYCSISMTPINGINLDSILFPEVLSLEIKVTDNSRSYTYSSGTIIPFYPEFIVSGNNFNAKGQLEFSKNNYYDKISIKHGLSEILLNTESDNISIYHISSQVDTSIYEIKIINTKESFIEKLSIYSPSTSQIKYIDIKYSNENSIILSSNNNIKKTNNIIWNDNTSANPNYINNPPSSSFHFILLSLITILALLLGYIFCKPTNSTPIVIQSPIRDNIKQENKPIEYSPSSPFQGSVTPF